jgi:hypothetical protein
VFHLLKYIFELLFVKRDIILHLLVCGTAEERNQNLANHHIPFHTEKTQKAFAEFISMLLSAEAILYTWLFL